MRYRLRTLLMVVAILITALPGCRDDNQVMQVQRGADDLERHAKKIEQAAESQSVGPATTDSTPDGIGPADTERYKRILASVANAELTYAAFFNANPLLASAKGQELEQLRQSLQPRGNGRHVGQSRPTSSVFTTIVLADKSSRTIAEIVVTDRLAYVNLDGVWIEFPVEEALIQRSISKLFHLKESPQPPSPF